MLPKRYGKPTGNADHVPNPESHGCSYIYVTLRSDKQKVMDYMKNGETSKMDPTYTPSTCSIFSKSPMEVDGLI